MFFYHKITLLQALVNVETKCTILVWINNEMFIVRRIMNLLIPNMELIFHRSIGTDVLEFKNY